MLILTSCVLSMMWLIYICELPARSDSARFFSKYFLIFFISELINCFIVVTSIFILSSTSQIEAHPVHIQKRQVTKMTEIEMKKALENILTGCKVAISQSSDAIETYVSFSLLTSFYYFLVVSKVVFTKHFDSTCKIRWHENQIFLFLNRSSEFWAFLWVLYYARLIS